MKETDVYVYKEELSRKIEEFKEAVMRGTTEPDRFLTITDIEKLWTDLRGSTSLLYSDMLTELLANIDETELIRKKKPNSVNME